MAVRVLHITDHLGAGGIQSYLLNLLRHWDDAGYTHHVAALHGPGANHERFAEVGVAPQYAAGSKRSLGIPMGLRRVIRDVQPDIVHAYGVPTCLLCEWLRGWLRIPLLITHLQSTYANHAGQRYQDILERLCYRRADHIIACSHAVAEGLRRRAPITIIPNGIDLERFSDASGRGAMRARMGYRDGDIVIGTSGRLVEGKDPWTLCRAFAALAQQHPDLRLLLVGGGPLHEELRKWLGDHGLSERTNITGFVSPGEVPGYLHAMDIFVFPSLREGSPLALMEAMAARLPCICADFPAAKEVITDGVDGVIFPRRDHGRLAQTVEELMHSDCAAMRAAAMEKAVRHFSSSVMCDRIAQVYECVARHAG